MMKDTNSWVLLLVLIIVFFFLGRCSNNGEIVQVPIEVVIPSEKGTSEVIVNPEPIKPTKGGEFKWKDKIIYTENEIDQKLAQDYVDLQEKFSGIELENERLNKVLSFIQIKDYEIPTENEFFTTINKIKVQGELKEFKQDFETKERKVTVDVPIKKKIEFLAGVEIGAKRKMEDFTVKGNLFARTKNGNLINVSVDSKETVWAGYAFKF